MININKNKEDFITLEDVLQDHDHTKVSIKRRFLTDFINNKMKSNYLTIYEYIYSTKNITPFPKSYPHPHPDEELMKQYLNVIDEKRSWNPEFNYWSKQHVLLRDNLCDDVEKQIHYRINYISDCEILFRDMTSLSQYSPEQKMNLIKLILEKGGQRNIIPVARRGKWFQYIEYIILLDNPEDMEELKRISPLISSQDKIEYTNIYDKRLQRFKNYPNFPQYN